MLSKARSKFIKSLQLKKYRKQEQCFVVEGEKSVLELLHSDFECIEVLGTHEFLERNRNTLSASQVEVTPVNETVLASLGDFSSNNAALAIARMRPNTPPALRNDEFCLMLDDLRDPGNFGTIIRTADWYNIHNIIASEESTDLYNSKVIHASMGSFTRVRVQYTNLETFLAKNSLPVLGTFLNGTSAHQFNFGKGGIIVIGNEAKGISKGVEQYVTHRISIPKYGHAESLNAAIATAVIFDNLRRLH